MIKIDLNLKKDYISGSKTSISKDVLENSSIFMKSLLKDTKDIKYYNNCSEDLKKDYDFVYFLISTFSTKRLFVEKVINNYIDNYDGKEDEFSIFSIAILGAKVLKDRYNATCERCMEICDKLYKSKCSKTCKYKLLRPCGPERREVISQCGIPSTAASIRTTENGWPPHPPSRSWPRRTRWSFPCPCTSAPHAPPS